MKKGPRYTINGVLPNKTDRLGSPQTLEDFPRLQKFFYLLISFFILSHLVLSFTAPHSFRLGVEKSHDIVSYIFPCVPAIFCGLSQSGFFTKRAKKSYILKIRSFIDYTSGLILACYLALFCPDGSDYRTDKMKPEPWMSDHSILSEKFYVIFLFCTICPTFFSRATSAALYYIMTCALYIEIDNPEFWWLLARNTCSFLLTIAIFGLTSNLHWKISNRVNELEEWNKVYRDILDRNPSCIAVINTSGKVMYSNPGFQDIAHDDPESFFESITNLRYRDMLNNSSHSHRITNFNSNLLLASPISPINSEESLVRRQNSLHNQKKTLARLSTKARMNTMHTFANLWQLLSHYNSRMDKEALEKDMQLIFEGKCVGRMSLLAKDSARDLGTTDRELRRGSTARHVTTYEIIIRPCTEYKKLIVILNNTTERDLIVGLENSSDYKDKILASVSHELRTPLNGNLGCIQAALNDKSVPEPTKINLLTPAFRSGKLLLHVIDDIMDYSQLHSKGIKLKLETKPIAETLNYCYELLEHSFQSKGLRLRIKLGEDLPGSFRTDHTRLKQIILNLLSNALKFTMQGGVTLRATCLKDSKVEIKVEDTGVGIKPQSMQKLFGEKMLHKAFGIKEVESKGVGLGLQISQKLAELLNDEADYNMPIHVSSVYGQGSSFVFVLKEIHEDEESSDGSSVSIDRLPDNATIARRSHQITLGSLGGGVFSQGEVPLEHAGDETFLQKAAKDYFKIKRPNRGRGSMFERRRTICTPKNLLNQRVLIVDDDPLNILVLESFITQFGLQKDSAHNGKEALEKVLKTPQAYKLILMDCQMPIMDGFEATRLLNRKMEEGEIPMVPIIGCTAFNSKDKLKKCIKSGMKEVLPKPVMKDQIGDVIKRYLGVGFA